MGTDSNPLGPRSDDADATSDNATPEPTAKDNDTEGQMMIPDGTARFLARDREKDIRRHLSARQLERSAQQSRKRK